MSHVRSNTLLALRAGFIIPSIAPTVAHYAQASSYTSAKQSDSVEDLKMAQELFAKGNELLAQLFELEKENAYTKFSFNPNYAPKDSENQAEIQKEIATIAIAKTKILGPVETAAEERARAFAYFNGSPNYLNQIKASVAQFEKLIAEEKAKLKKTQAKKQQEELLAGNLDRVFAIGLEVLEKARIIEDDTNRADQRFTQLAKYFAKQEIDKMRSMIAQLKTFIDAALKTKEENLLAAASAHTRKFEEEQHHEERQEKCNELYNSAIALGKEVFSFTKDDANSQEYFNKLKLAKETQDFATLQAITTKLKEQKTEFNNDLNEQFRLGDEYATQIAKREKSSEKAIARKDILEATHKAKDLKALRGKVSELGQELNELVLAEVIAKTNAKVDRAASRKNSRSTFCYESGDSSAYNSDDEYPDTLNNGSTGYHPNNQVPRTILLDNLERELQEESKETIPTPVLEQTKTRRIGTYSSYNFSNQSQDIYGFGIFSSRETVLKEIDQQINEPDSPKNTKLP